MSLRLYLEQFGPIQALPVLHNRMEFAQLVRMAFSRVRPEAVAIELPATLEAPFIRALRRLPQISLISYQAGRAAGAVEPQTVYLLVEPADPLVEAARLALEQGLPLYFIDVDTDNYPRHHEALPRFLQYLPHRPGTVLPRLLRCQRRGNSRSRGSAP